jgi:hypothetical protein
MVNKWPAVVTRIKKAVSSIPAGLKCEIRHSCWHFNNEINWYMIRSMNFYFLFLSFDDYVFRCPTITIGVSHGLWRCRSRLWRCRSLSVMVSVTVCDGVSHVCDAVGHGCDAVGHGLWWCRSRLWWCRSRLWWCRSRSVMVSVTICDGVGHGLWEGAG